MFIENETIKLTGDNKRNKEITVEVKVIENIGGGECLIRWTDGKVAKWTGYNVTRNSKKFQTLLKNAYIN